jgi:hypothetical protein
MERGPTIKSLTEDTNKFLHKKIKEKVFGAIHSAPHLEDIQLISLNKKDKDNEEKIDKLLDKSTIEAENLHEYKLILETIGLSEDEIKDLLAHENAHANKAESLGAKHLSYKITIMIDKNNNYLYQPFSHIYIPEEWSDEKVKDTWVKIAKAPEEYGNKMSSSDIEMSQE